MISRGWEKLHMPKGTNQKFKLYRLAQIMMKKTDEEHYITMPEIKEALAEYDITADRKSLYNDLRDLEILGIEVEGEQDGNRYRYHVSTDLLNCRNLNFWWMPFSLPSSSRRRNLTA